METLTILFKAVIVGALTGFAIGAGAARMFHTPKVQGLGSFRTLGELNSCAGDSISHFTFGLGFFFKAWASAVGVGAITSETDHRVLPHWTAAVALRGKKNPEETLHDPKKMGIIGAFVGAITVGFLCTTASAIPESLQVVAMKVLGPAANLLIVYVMPAIFWLAALDAGKRTGFWGTLFGGTAQLIMGNAVPGVVLGILLGKGVDDLGWTRAPKAILTTIIILFTLSAFFRGSDLTLLTQMNMDHPEWLINLHKMVGQEVK
jgi:uncharacterized protein (TIGR03580 family)